MVVVSRRSARSSRVRPILLIGLAVVLSACSFGVPAPATTPTDGTADIRNYQDARQAVIRVVAQGGFVDPADPRGYPAGAASGFLIDSTGLAITTNRAVGGAAAVQVFFDSEGEGRELSALVLGTSECADLALIDLEGEGYAALQWASGEPAADDEVYALGYDSGSSEVATRRGTLTEIAVAAQTPWLAQRSVLQHNARATPANAGGPLLTADGRVLGVLAFGANGRTFALPYNQIETLLPRLSDRELVEALGVNLMAITIDDTSGLWVSAVRTGSPAGAAGLRPGDVILELENLALRGDTLADYCGVLRSRPGDEPIGLRVLRPTTGEVLEGSFNGERLAVVETLEPAGPIAEQPTSIPDLEPTAVAAVEPTATAVPEPTATAPLPSLMRPGSRTLQEYEAQVGAMRQLIFETFDRGNQTRAI
ncbi:MAG TPA: S1C family serine protease, partial [Roseiflexaceae bacterium]|nr:S1C family serine protease [Roseiflexaceae bacterium]